MKDIDKMLDNVKGVIAAYRIRPGQVLPDVSHIAQCSICGHDVGALRETIEKCKDPEYLLICKEVCLGKVLEIVGPSPYGGTFNTPAEFRKVHP